MTQAETYNTSPLIGAKTHHNNFNSNNNKLKIQDQPVHDWYRFVLSFPPHFVNDFIRRFNLNSTKTLLDPFCGTGTTLVEAKMNGIPNIGIEAHPMAHFASLVKTKWNIDPYDLKSHAEFIALKALSKINSEGIDDESFFTENETKTLSLKALSSEKMKLLLTNSISPLPLHKTLVLLESIHQQSENKFCNHELLALARALVNSISNLKFGPEVGIGKIKEDAPVIRCWLSEISKMTNDLITIKKRKSISTKIYQGDAREIHNYLQQNSIDAVITSPPYPNEKDYTRTTRLESVLLGFISNKNELQQLKKSMLRSNTRGIYKDDNDDSWVRDHFEIQHIAKRIENRRIELGKTSGFERLYPRVTKLYFGGMTKHFANLRKVLKPGAQLAYIVGDQASYLRVLIQTGRILAEIAQSLGYELIDIELFRTRLATATKEQLREEIIHLRWKG